MNPDKSETTIEDLRNLLARLRGPTGCPWDRKQTPQTLRTYLLEEAYELAEALERQSDSDVHEELGDLLFILLFITRIYEERKSFDLSQVLETIHGKMVRRHPHVFGEAGWSRAEEVVQGWQTIKAGEKPQATPFDSIPTALPGLLKAHRLAQRAAGLGFDWPDGQTLLQKVHEELRELEEALEGSEPESVREELGDLLFVLVNVGRFYGISAESALQQANDKFQKRFLRLMETRSFQERSIRPLTPEDWAALWRQVQRREDS